MKTKTKSLGKVFSFAVAGALFAPLAVWAGGWEATPVSIDANNAELNVVTGRIVAKSDTSITVNGETIAVTGATAFIKDAAAVSIGDIKAGDQVRVAVAKNPDGTWQAQSIEVLKAAD